MVDFTFARAAVAHTYGKNGNESVDPAILLKLMFLLFSENVRGERELMRRLPERLAWLWFLGDVNHFRSSIPRLAARMAGWY